MAPRKRTGGKKKSDPPVVSKSPKKDSEPQQSQAQPAAVGAQPAEVGKQPNPPTELKEVVTDIIDMLKISVRPSKGYERGGTNFVGGILFIGLDDIHAKLQKAFENAHPVKTFLRESVALDGDIFQDDITMALDNQPAVFGIAEADLIGDAFAQKFPAWFKQLSDERSRVFIFMTTSKFKNVHPVIRDAFDLCFQPEVVK